MRRAGSCPLAAFALLVLLASTAELPARTPALLDRLGPAQGLPNSYVEALAQDRHGFLWIGTRGGLVRHEGARLRVLRHDPDRPDSLPGNNITALLAARDGAIWAGISGQGLIRLEGTAVTEHFSTSARGGPLRGNYLWSLAESCDGAIWGVYARDGVMRIDPVTRTALHFTPGDHGLPEGGFGLQLLSGPDCVLWMVRADGLWTIDPSPPHEFVQLLEAEQSGLEILLSLAFVAEDRAWLGGRGALAEVLLQADGRPQVARRIDTPGPVSVLRADPDGDLWVGLDEEVWLLDADAAVAMRLGADVREEIGPLQISDLLPGQEGEIWIATAGSGTIRLPPGWRGLSAFPSASDQRGPRSMTALATEPGGRVWLGAAGVGVQWIDPDSGARGPIVPVEVGAARRTSEVIDLVADRDGLWILLRRFLVRLQHGDDRLETVLERDLDGDARFEFIEDDGEGGLWLGIEDGQLLRLGPGAEVRDHWHLQAETARLLDEAALLGIRRGPEGDWWLLGSRGLTRLAPDGRPRRVALDASPARLQTMAFEGDRLWLASDSLLQRFRIDGDILIQELRLTAGDGLPHGRIQALVPRSEALWVLTSAGAARLDLADLRFRHFSAAEGLRRAEFNPEAVAVLEDGRILAGSTTGLLEIDPTRIQRARRPPPVWLTGLRAGDREWSLRPQGPRSFALDWRESTVRLSWLALSYLNPEATRYRVRLHSWDADWQPMTAETLRDYGRLPSGRYRFEVQAAGVDGLWNRTGDALEFRIAPPPWRTGKAWTGYALAGLLLASILWRQWLMRRRRLAALRSAREQKRLAEAASAAKSEFLAIASHELRTPLHGLLGMMELLEPRLERGPGADMLATMRRSGRQLKRIVDDVLDLSSIEAGRIDLEPVAFSLPDLLEQIVELRAGEAWSKGLALRLRIASDLPVMVWADPDRLLQMLGNLLGNAVKFTARGAVELEARLDAGGRLVLAVSDTGPGIDPERIDGLFQPYARLLPQGAARAEGTGLGLAICRRLAEAMGGSIDLASRPGRGSRFTLRLPLPGLVPAAPQASALLDGLGLVSALPAPERRVLHRLARRWRIRWDVLDRADNSSGNRSGLSVLLTSPGRIAPDRIAEWTRAGRPGLWLAMDGPPPLGLVEIRPPLTEARLLVALFELRLAALDRR